MTAKKVKVSINKIRYITTLHIKEWKKDIQNIQNKKNQIRWKASKQKCQISQCR